MIKSLSSVSTFGEMMRVLAGINPATLDVSSINKVASAPETSASFGSMRVDSSPSSSQRVDVSEKVSRYIGELERANNVGALRSVAVTAFNTMNSSIKRVHQGQ